MSPAVMGMFDTTEFIFDIAQSDEDVVIDGHWRGSVVHQVSGDIFATGHLMRVQPYWGDDFWDFAIGARKKTAGSSSMGGEFLYTQQKDADGGGCAIPSAIGARGDIDHELSGTQVVSAGAMFRTGSCSDNGISKSLNSLEFKGAFTMMF